MNDNLTRVIVAPITSNVKKLYPFDYLIKSNYKTSGKVLLHQLRAVDKRRLGKKVETISLSEMKEINQVLEFVLGLR